MVGKNAAMLDVDEKTTIAAKALWAGERTLGVRKANTITNT
jgi:hypothetical protein